MTKYLRDQTNINNYKDQKAGKGLRPNLLVVYFVTTLATKKVYNLQNRQVACKTRAKTMTRSRPARATRKSQISNSIVRSARASSHFCLFLCLGQQNNNVK